MKKQKFSWKTKTVGKHLMMIRQNSEPDESRYAEWGPKNGPCTNMVKFSSDVASVLCSDCVQRSLNGF